MEGNVATVLVALDTGPHLEIQRVEKYPIVKTKDAICNRRRIQVQTTDPSLPADSACEFPPSRRNVSDAVNWFKKHSVGKSNLIDDFMLCWFSAELDGRLMSL